MTTNSQIHPKGHGLINSATSAETDELTGIISAHFGYADNIVCMEFQRHDLFIATLRLNINETEYCAFYGLPAYSALKGFIEEIMQSRSSLVLPCPERTGTVVGTSLCGDIPAMLVLIESDAELIARISDASHEVWVQNAYKEEFLGKR